jgi:hypothetical protein
MQNAEITPWAMMMHAPLCAPCNKKTLLARVLPRDEGEEVHIFECPICAQSQSLIVKSE